MTLSRQAPRAFTLVEILMAIMLGGLILTAAASFVFGVFNLNLMAEKEPMFEEHVESSTRFVEYLFDSALPEGEGGQSGDNARGNADEPESRRSPRNRSEEEGPRVAWKRIPGASGLNEEALSFTVNGDLPVFVDEEQAFLPKVECWLIFERDAGLVLKWRTEEMSREDADQLMTSVLSPYVEELTYWYYDREDDRWEDSDQVEKADEGGNQMPTFISLKFVHPDEREARRYLLLPASEDGKLLL